VRKELHDVKQVAWVLAVHRRYELATLHILERHHRDFEVALQRIARGAGKRCAAHRTHRSPHHEISLDPYLDTIPAHQQLGLAGIARGDSSVLKAHPSWIGSRMRSDQEDSPVHLICEHFSALLRVPDLAVADGSRHK